MRFNLRLYIDDIETTDKSIVRVVTKALALKEDVASHIHNYYFDLLHFDLEAPLEIPEYIFSLDSTTFTFKLVAKSAMETSTIRGKL